ncbi:MAG: hypothetical protein JXQ90_10970 [Cyclobacteriaceae bacterium]
MSEKNEDRFEKGGMGMSWEDKMEQWENGTQSLSEEELASLNLMKDAITGFGELQLKEELNGYHDQYQRKVKIRKITTWSFGIAASVLLAWFWMRSSEVTSEQSPFQMNQPPVYSDSATYSDTLKMINDNESQKN